MFLVAQLIHAIAQVLILLVIISAILSYFVSPYHPVREAIDRIVDPLLNPIRNVLPIMGGFDFSPLVLILLIGLIDQVLTNIFLRL